MGRTINQRNNYWQIIRAICILAVVMIHCPSGISHGRDSLEFYIQVVLRQVINFPVALFIFLAAYFTNLEQIEKNAKAYILIRGGVSWFLFSCGRFFIRLLRWYRDC